MHQSSNATNTMAMKHLHSLCTLTLALSLTWASSLSAASFTWHGAGTNTLFSNTNNWVGGATVAPNGGDIHFGPVASGGQTNATVDVGGNPNGFYWDAGAPSMFVTNSGGGIQFGATGNASPIQNNSGTGPQTFTRLLQAFCIGGAPSRTWAATAGDLVYGAGINLRPDSAPAAWTLIFNGPYKHSVNGNITTSGGGKVYNLSVGNGGTLVLGGSGAWTGVLTISSGTVQAAANNPLPLGNTNNVILGASGTSGTLDLNGYTMQTALITSNALATAAMVTNSSLTATGTLALCTNITLDGSVAIVDGASKPTALKVAAATTTIATAYPTFTGGATVAAGTLRFNVTNALAADSPIMVASGASLLPAAAGTYSSFPCTITGFGTGGSSQGALDFHNGNAPIVDWPGTITLNGNAAIGTYGVTYNVTLGGPIKGTGDLTLQGQGGSVASHSTLFHLAAQSSYTGNTIMRNNQALANATLRLETNNALPPTSALTLDITSGGVNTGTQVTFDLNGYSQQLAGLATAGATSGARVILNNGASPSTLTVGNTNSWTFSGTIGGGSSDINLVKTGAGMLTLTGANTYSGATTVSNGTLVITAASTGNSACQVLGQATFGVRVPLVGTTLNLSSLTLESGSTNNTILSLPGNPTAPIISAASLFVNGPITLNLSGSQMLPGTFPLITYSSFSGSFSNLRLGTLPPGVKAELIDNLGSVDLHIISAVNELVWKGQVNGNWDILVSTNWLDQNSLAPAAYSETSSIGDYVRLDDTASGTTSLCLVGTLHPLTVTVDNSSLAYTLSGSGKLSGITSLIKTNTGTLVVVTDNDQTNGTVLGGGTLQVGNGGSHGALGSGAVSVAAAGTTLAFNRSDAILVNNTIANAGGNPSLALNSGSVTLGGAFDNAGAAATVNAGSALLLAKTSSSNVHALGGGLTIQTDGLVQLGGTGGDQIYDSVNVTMGGGTFDMAGLNEKIGNVSGAGVLTNSGVSATLTLGGALYAANGTLSLRAGNITRTGTWNNRMGVAGGGAFDMSGGTFNSGDYFAVGTTDGTGTGTANLSGGVFNSSSEFLVGFSKPGVLNVGGTAQLSLNWLSYGDTGNSATVYLNGGTVALTRFHARGSGTSVLFFNGSLIQAKTAGVTDFIQPATHAYVSTNGAVFDTLSYAIGIPQALETDPELGAAADGGLKKLGMAALTLSGANTYTGPTIVSNGTLIVNGSIGSGALTVSAAAALSGTGAITGPVTVQAGGTLAPGTTIGALSINNTLTLNALSTNVFEINSSALAGDQVLGLSAVTYGGRLVITNLAGGSIAAPMNFKLFDAATYHPAQFSAIQWPALAPNLMWTNMLNVDGTVAVIAYTPTEAPQVAGVAMLPDHNFSLMVTGAIGSSWSLRATNKVAEPVANWPVIQTGTVTTSPFIVDDLDATNHAQRFYRFSAP